MQLHGKTVIFHLTAIVAYCPQSGTLQTNLHNFVDFIDTQSLKVDRGKIYL